MSAKPVAKSSLALRLETSGPTLLEMCSVRVGTTLFGLPITHILEIVGHTRPQDVPLAPVFVGGLIHYRGDVLTTVSLRQLLGLPRQNAAGKDGKVECHDIIVLESSAGCFGLLVDSVGEVLTVSSADYEPNPSILNASRSSLFAGAYKLQHGLLVMLDPEKLEPMLLGATAA
jgi:purine-binding chemotaxis protein CheW